MDGEKHMKVRISLLLTGEWIPMGWYEFLHTTYEAGGIEVLRLQAGMLYRMSSQDDRQEKGYGNKVSWLLIRDKKQESIWPWQNHERMNAYEYFVWKSDYRLVQFLHYAAEKNDRHRFASCDICRNIKMAQGRWAVRVTHLIVQVELVGNTSQQNEFAIVCAFYQQNRCTSRMTFTF